MADPLCDSVDGNRLVPLESGPEQRDALLALIDGAEKSLRLLYYIYADDASGRRVRDALIAARRRGVAVTLIVDGFGSDEASDNALFDPLVEAGADVCRFLPRYGRRYLLRNHQKMALADERAVIIGGFNISDDYFGTIEDEAWRDLGLLVEGPAAARLTRYFDILAGWTRSAKPRIRDLRRALRGWRQPSGPVHWLLGGPARRLSPWARAIKRDMQRATRMTMIAAYFAPNPPMLRRMDRLGKRGDTRVITASKSDNSTTIGAARFCYAGLLRKGVRVFEYQPTKLHTKLFVIDDKVYVGSANFDMRSLYLNLELMLCVQDQAFADRMTAYFEREAANSREITLADVSGWRMAPVRLRWALCYFIVAVVDYTVTRRLNFDVDGL
jgi:cardiolipin synthase